MSKSDSELSRRNFLGGIGSGIILAAAAPLVLPTVAEAAPQKSILRISKAVSAKSLSLINLHTGERLKETFWEKGEYNLGALSDLNRIFRDHRTNEITEMDTRLYDLLYAIQAKVGAVGKQMEIICGYRSEQTNEQLREESFARHNGRRSGVAKRSYHLDGKAADINIPGVSLKNLRKAALALNSGGVGYYPRNNFLHVDTGPVRKW